MSVWQEIKDRLDVVDVLSQYISLSAKGGGNYAGRCPFHNEKTASLIASRDKQIWHCFGCGEGGDIFTFVEKIENLTTNQALKNLAKEAGVTLEIKAKSQEDEIKIDLRQKKLLLLDWLANFYHSLLLKELQNKDSLITKYCFERGLTLEIIKKFKLGLAPNQSIIEKLTKGDKEKLELFQSLGLIKNTDS
jgi:DNA primase